MEASMRPSSSQETSAGHRPRVADSSSGAPQQQEPTSGTGGQSQPPSNPPNFEYDDNEWDIGIGDLIIDLDADIEKTTEQQQRYNHHPPPPTVTQAIGGMASAPQAAKQAASKQLAIEHSATVDKGLKMKIKRTKPGTKTSEAKHEIVKPGEAHQHQQNGQAALASATEQLSPAAIHGQATAEEQLGKGQPPVTKQANCTPTTASPAATAKRGSSGHRRDKASRDKHQQPGIAGAPPADNKPTGKQPAEINGIVRLGGPQSGGAPRTVFPASTGPGPPPPASSPAPGPPAASSPASVKQEQARVPQVINPAALNVGALQDDGSDSPPPPKKLKTEFKETADVCVGTSVGTITEPDCLGPCEPGTSVTLEGIVWHETEGGVLVVNVTWRGKTYVGTLLDCTRHDWAPPRFCDSPTSDLDNRTPKGRETRSSVHSKLRNGGGGGGAKGRRGATSATATVVSNGAGTSGGGPSSPTPFLPPRPEPGGKRKVRSGEEDTAAQQPPTATSGIQAGKKARPPAPPCQVATVSPPSSPVLLECPEPNCSKKYKHINGLKYHQSHAHGATVDDDDTKDITSMSENDESNIEPPSPATPVKSPSCTEKGRESPVPGKSKEEETTALLRIDVPSQPVTPRSTPPSPAMPSENEATPEPLNKVVKPGVLRFAPEQEYPPPPPVLGAFSTAKPQLPGPPMSTVDSIPARSASVSGLQPSSQSLNPCEQPLNPCDNASQSSQPPYSVQMPPSPQQQQFLPSPGLIVPSQPVSHPLPLSPKPPECPSPGTKGSTPAQFKVKPTAALMPDEKKLSQPLCPTAKLQSFKKKSRKSPAGSPHPQPEMTIYGGQELSGGREEVQSPAYSDISDDGAPVIDADLTDKGKVSGEKKGDSGQPLPHIPQYGMYYYGQPQYLVPSVPDKGKEPDKPDKVIEKEVVKKEGEYGTAGPQKVLPQHYYPYYMAGYPYGMDPGYGGVSMVAEDKGAKEDGVKENTGPLVDPQGVKQVGPPMPIPNPIQVPTPGKVKTDSSLMKDKHQNENHQIIKESIEIKNQMNPYTYPRQPPQQQQQQQQPQQQPPPQQQAQGGVTQAAQVQAQREEEVRRFYVYSAEQRRKEQEHKAASNVQQTGIPGGKPMHTQAPTASGPVKHKEAKTEEKKEKPLEQPVKQEQGVKPTMETQGPPPPPTSQYAYIHPGYMQSAHYGTLPFDPNHPMYRGIMVPGPYGGSPYLHPQLPRYHAAPEDLSRGPPAPGPGPPSKTLDMLQHHAQYYSAHKIHELQERAIKSPTPGKGSVSAVGPGASPQGQPGGQQGPGGQSQGGGPQTAPGGGPQVGGKQPQQGEGKEARSPPPQRHVHTHHHTHVGLGYPMYPATYGAAVLASQQAAAVTVINPYPTK